jgi:transposase-like protein
MELARLPPEPQRELTKPQEAVLEALTDGMTVRTVAEKIGGDDMAKRKLWRRRIRYWMKEDPLFRAHLGLAAAGESMLATPAMVQAQIKRAMRGRTDAARLMFEVSGFHNPKVQHNHEHSGTIDINLKMGGRPEPVVDAEVVED